MTRPPRFQSFGEYDSQLYAFFPKFRAPTLFRPNIDINYNKKHKLVMWFMNTIWTHEKRGFEIDTNIVELGEMITPLISNQPWKCPMCGKKVHLNKPTQRNRGARLTIDIINPNWRIMCKENVRFVCLECNHNINKTFEYASK